MYSYSILSTKLEMIVIKTGFFLQKVDVIKRPAFHSEVTQTDPSCIENSDKRF